MKKVLILEDEVNIRSFVVINLKRAGYDGYVSIEFEGSGDCIEGIGRGLNNLRKMIAALD